MKRNVVAALFRILLATSCATGLSQKVDPGREVYTKASKSIFSILTRSSDSVSQGTGFLVGPGKILTNNHVVSAGAPVIDLGPIKVPAKVDRVDSFNDLAILSVDAEISAAPLRLAPSPRVSRRDGLRRWQSRRARKEH
jgi:S1-C subfamily serine protease